MKNKVLPILLLVSVLSAPSSVLCQQITASMPSDQSAVKPPEEICDKLYLEVRSMIRANLPQLLEIVSREISKQPKCSCEIIKAAIDESKANANLVAAIVEAALGSVSEEYFPAIVQCALAAAPDATARIRSLVGKLALNNPSLNAILKPNPLDFPHGGPVGPAPGGPGGLPALPAPAPVLVKPPKVTNVDP